MSNNEAMRFTGRLAIVTGGARGLGREIARGLAAEGASVILADINLREAEHTAAAIDAVSGSRVVPLLCNVANTADIQAMRTFAEQEFGRIDILVNNAGLCSLKGIEALGEQDWDEMLDVNLKGVFFCSQAVTPLMKKQGTGSILNLSSIAGKVGGLVVGPHYAASKAGVICLTQSFARALAPFGVRVNAVAPGPVDTEMSRAWPEEVKEGFAGNIPLGGRFAEIREVCAAALFLLSEAAGYITGEILDVNGGLLMD